MAALSALSCWYFLFYLLYFMAFQLLYRRIRDGRWSSGWTLRAPILCLGATLLLLSPWLVHMIGAPARTYPGNNIFVADPLAMIAFPPTHLLARYGAGVYAALSGNAWENTIYLGLVNLAVLGWALTRKGEKRLLHYALGGMVFFAVIAAGELLHVGGHITRLPLPGVVLANLPFFGNARTPARAMVMVYLFLSLGLAQACVMALTRRTAAARAVMALTVLLMVLDFTPASLGATPAACPAALDVIAGDPGRFGVLDLPRGYVEGNAAMMLSACHGHPIVAGETARKMGDTLEDRLVATDLAAQRRQLAAAQVKYIVLHRPQGELYRWNKADGRLADYASVYKPVADDGRLMVLGVY